MLNISSKYSFWYIKIDPPQNQDLSTSLERSYKELLNACFSFEIYYSKLNKNCDIIFINYVNIVLT